MSDKKKIEDLFILLGDIMYELALELTDPNNPCSGIPLKPKGYDGRRFKRER